MSTKRRSIVELTLGLVAAMTLAASFSVLASAAPKVTTPPITCANMNCKPDQRACTDGSIQPGCWANGCNEGPDLICDFCPSGGC
jgi:hypothetical protein